MKKILFIILLFSVSPQLIAQITLSRVSFGFGYIRNYTHVHLDYNKYSISPELKVGGKFVKEYFEWELSMSYWNEDLDNIKFADGATYSYSTTTLGIRLNYFPQYALPKFLLPVHLVLGLSSRLTNEFYNGGSSARDDNSFFIYSVDLGGGLNFNVIKQLRIRCEALAFIPLNKDEQIYSNKIGGSVKVGIDYIFGD